jgi:monoamine oxidase
MNHTEIIVIGAGAAGLIAAKELITSGHQVTIVEARDRVGGRIYTVRDDRFPLPVELGAEFVHGDLALTKQLLKEAGAEFYQTKGDLWRSQNGEFAEQEDFIEGIEEVIKRLKELPTDISVAEFLDQHFSGERYVTLRKTLKGFVEGYDAADSTVASSFALLQELLGAEDKQYRIKGGYIKIIDYLLDEYTKRGGKVYLETIVKEIRWKKGNVELIDQTNRSFIAEKVVITVPLGVLQIGEQDTAGIIFSPAINDVQQAIHSLGFGSVIKIILNFEQPVWKIASNNAAAKKKDPGFIFSDAIIPTWWTQIPEQNGMITGWVGGPNAVRLQHEPDEKLVHLALESLAVIFKIPRQTLQSKLMGSCIHNWSKNEFSRGAYSFETIHSKKAKAMIATPIQDTLYFAGEAFEGSESGTVEAALVSGQKAAKKLLDTTGY